FTSAPPAKAPAAGLLAVTGLSDLWEGIRYVRQQSHVAALMFVKAGWGLAGGVLLLLTIFGQRIFPIAGSTAAGIGVLYGARGVAAELALVTLTSSLSSFGTGYALDRIGWSPRALAFTLGAMFTIPGVLWMIMLARWRETDTVLTPPDAVQTGEEEFVEGR